MREIYLPPFKAAVVEADAFGVMAAYNKVNGWWCSENDILQNEILRNEWGFAGMIISDWGGTHSTKNAVTNGLNVEMPGKKYLGEALLDSVKAGLVSEEIINQRVREILRVRMAIKPIPEDEANKEITSQPAQQKIAYEVACKSIVLLKNDGVLPLDLSKKSIIAVIGANATQTMATGGMGAGVKTLYEVTPLEGLKNRVGDKAEILFAQGYEPYVFRWGRRSAEQQEKEAQEKEIKAKELMKEALDVAAKADIILFMGGDNRSVETEGSDRKDIFLPSGQDELIQKIAEVNPNIITVLVSGAPNDLNIVKPISKALLISWFNGTEGGNALADVLVGNISPSGRLPFTLPIKLEDSPAYALGNYPQGKKSADIFANLVSQTDSVAKSNDNKSEDALNSDPNTAYYSEESLVGYRWFDTKNLPVMYPFGFGLTYTNFEYSSLSIPKDEYGKNDIITVSFELKNSGSMSADEVVQAYVHRINPSVEWPYKELKSFSRVTLSPGESKKVTLEIPVKSLQYWNAAAHAWDDDLCRLEVQIGAYSGDIKLKKEVKLK